MARHGRSGLAFILASACNTALPEVASTAPAADGPSLSGDVTLLSDYRYRGLTQSAGRPAPQVTVNVDLDSLYLQLWGSALRDPAKAGSEVDIEAGRKLSLAGLDIEAGLSRHIFPGADRQDYWELPISCSKSYRGWSGTLTYQYAPAQKPTSMKSNKYSTVSVAWRPTVDLALEAEIGREVGAFSRGKTDWSLGVSKVLVDWRVAMSFVGARDDVRHGAVIGSVQRTF